MSFGVQSAGLFGGSSQTGSSGSNSLRPFANLGLTEDQRSQIRSIFKNAKSQGLSQSQTQQEVDAVLTPTQLTTLQADGSAQSSTAGTSSSAQPPRGNPFADPNGPFANLDLTSDQQSQIASIIQSGQSQGLSFDQINAQINTVLTTSQQATFATDLQNLPPPPTSVQNAQATVSGQSQTGSGGTSASTTSSTSSTTATTDDGLTESDIQQQIAAAQALVLKQLESEVASTTLPQ